MGEVKNVPRMIASMLGDVFLHIANEILVEHDEIVPCMNARVEALKQAKSYHDLVQHFIIVKEKDVKIYTDELADTLADSHANLTDALEKYYSLKFKIARDDRKSNWDEIGKNLAFLDFFPQKKKRGRSKSHGEKLDRVRAILIDKLKCSIRTLIDSDGKPFGDITDKQAIEVYRYSLKHSDMPNDKYVLETLEKKVKLNRGAVASLCKSISTGRTSLIRTPIRLNVTKMWKHSGSKKM